MVIYIAGSNVFGQWISHDLVLAKFQNLLYKKDTNINFDTNFVEVVAINWSYNVFQCRNSFYLAGYWRGKCNQLAQLCISEDSTDLVTPSIFNVVGNDNSIIFVEINTLTLWILSLRDNKDVKKIIINIETPINQDESLSKKSRANDYILKVVCTNTSFLCLTNGGLLYSGFIPSYVDTSFCLGKICDISCGYEHNIFLTDAGIVYTWGNGRRLQLGHGDLNNLDEPSEVQALAGIRIVKVKAGGWHNLALSDSGDLYVWGWNDIGQLGIKPDAKKNINSERESDEDSYVLPRIVDLFDDEGKSIELNVIDIACGTRHSAILLEDNSVWTSGFNKYGQLGFAPTIFPNITYFKKSFVCKSGSRLMCGPWSTVVIND